MRLQPNSEKLKPICKLQLNDRPYHSTVSADGRRFAACASSGKCWLFDNDLRQLDEVTLGAGVQWIQLNKIGSLLLVGFQARIDVHATSPKIAPLFKLPVPGTSSQCCVFCSDEQVVCVASWDLEPKLTAWDLRSSAKIAELLLPDRGGAGYSLVPHPEGEAMAAIAYSGQSEEWLFWAHYARGKLRVLDRPEIEDVALPCFHPTGREFVSFHERLGLCRMRFPSGELIGSVQPEQVFADNPEDMFSYDIHFLRDDHFLVWQTCLALYEFDLATLQPVGAVLTGVEGVTFGEDNFYSGQSWLLAGGRLLTSDCRHDKKFKNRTDTLRLWDAAGLAGRVSAPDPSRPLTQEIFADDQ